MLFMFKCIVRMNPKEGNMHDIGIVCWNCPTVSTPLVKVVFLKEAQVVLCPTCTASWQKHVAAAKKFYLA